AEMEGVPVFVFVATAANVLVTMCKEVPVVMFGEQVVVEVGMIRLPVPDAIVKQREVHLVFREMVMMVPGMLVFDISAVIIPERSRNALPVDIDVDPVPSFQEHLGAADIEIGAD